MPLQVVAIDGTVIECDSFQPKNKGLMLQEKHQNQPETVGFMPYDRLMYVIPEETVYNLEEMDEMPI